VRFDARRQSGADGGNRPRIRVAVDLTDSYPWPITAMRWACFAGPRVEPASITA